MWNFSREGLGEDTIDQRLNTNVNLKTVSFLAQAGTVVMPMSSFDTI